MTKFTNASIKKAMMEQSCMGLEGHAPKNYTWYWDGGHPGYIRVQCRKCNLEVALNHAHLENEPSEPNPTPPYNWGDG